MLQACSMQGDCQLPTGVLGKQFQIVSRQERQGCYLFTAQCLICGGSYTVDTLKKKPWDTLYKHVTRPSKKCQNIKAQQQAERAQSVEDRDMPRPVGNQADTPHTVQAAVRPQLLAQPEAEVTLDPSITLCTPSSVHGSLQAHGMGTPPRQLHSEYQFMDVSSINQAIQGASCETPACQQASDSACEPRQQAGEAQVSMHAPGDDVTTQHGSQIEIFSAQEIAVMCKRCYQLPSEQQREVALLNGGAEPLEAQEADIAPSATHEGSAAYAEQTMPEPLLAPGGASASAGDASTIYRFKESATGLVHDKVSEYIKVLSEPVDPIHRPNGITVADAVSLIEEWRLKFPSVPKQAADEMCALIKYGILRDDASKPISAQREDSNYFPSSLRVVDNIIGLKPRVDIEWHYCPCGKFAWPPYTGELADLKEVKCVACKRDRVICDPKTGRYYAPQPFWYFGLECAIKEFFMTNPDWAPYRGTSEARQNTFYTSQWSQWLRDHPNVRAEVLDDPRNSAYALGFDWFQPFQWKSHSAGVVVLRCLDVEDKYLSLGSNCFPLMVIGGPKEPPCMLPLLHIIAADFNKFGPDSKEGMLVTPSLSALPQPVAPGTVGGARTSTAPASGAGSGRGAESRHGECSNPTDPVQQAEQTFQHRVVLGLVEADKPAQSKVSAVTGHTGYVCCHWCAINGTACPGWRGHMYIKGYEKPTLLDKQKIKGLSRDPPAYLAGDEELVLSAAEIANRGKQYIELFQEHQRAVAEAKLNKTKQPQLGINPYGATGACGLDVLPYFNMRDHFAISAAHCAVRGVGSQLTRYLFQPLKFKPLPAVFVRKTQAAKRTPQQAGGGGTSEPAQISQVGQSRTKKRKRKSSKVAKGKRAAKRQQVGCLGTDDEVSDPEAVPDPDPQGGPQADAGGNLPLLDQGEASGAVRTVEGVDSGAQVETQGQPGETPGSVNARQRWQDWCSSNPDWQSRVWFVGPIVKLADKKRMTQRGVDLRLSCDQSRPYTCVVKCLGKFGTIEQMLAFHSPISPLIMRGIELGGSQEFTQLFHALNRAIAFFARPHIPVQTMPGEAPLSFDDAKRRYHDILQEHDATLHSWARFAEAEGLPDPLFTSNLHTMHCRAATQCRQLGHCGTFLEMYIERVILSIKSGIRGKVSMWPEKVMINQLLLRLARASFALQYGARSKDEILERGVYRESYGRASDTGQTDDPPEQEYLTCEYTLNAAAYTWDGQHFQHRLEGRGKVLTEIPTAKLALESRQTVRQIISTKVQYMASQRQLPQQLADAFVRQVVPNKGMIVVFNGLLWRQAVRMLAYSHPTERVRQSFWVLLRVACTVGRSVQHKMLVGKVLSYVYCKLPVLPEVRALPNFSTLPSSGLPPPLCLALVCVYATTEVTDFGNQLFKVDTTNTVQLAGSCSGDNSVVKVRRGKHNVFEEWHLQAVSVDDIVSKVIYTLDDENGNVMWCTKTAPVTGRLFDELSDLQQDVSGQQSL